MREGSAFLVVHPRAKLRFPRKFAALIRGLEEEGRVFASAESSDASDITRLCRKALEEGYTRILPVGGDGTLSLCVQAFMEDGRNVFPEAAILPLPFGTGNDFYRGLGAKSRAKDWTWTKQPLQRSAISLGSFRKRDGNEQYFINSFSVGISVDILEDYSRSGLRSYLLSTVKTVKRYRSADVALSRDGKRHEKPTLLLMICKGPYVGGGMRLDREADHRSGRAKVIWIPRLSFATIVRNFPRIYRGGLESIDGLESFDLCDFDLELAPAGNRVEADGELYDVPRIFGISYHPRCIDILFPA